MESDQSTAESAPTADQLITEARGGSAAALDQLMELLSGNLWAELGCRRRRRGLGPSRGVSDLIQDTLIRAQMNFSSFERETFADFRQWARTIMFRRWQQWARDYRSRNGEPRKERIWRALYERTERPSDSDSLIHREEVERAYRLFKQTLRPNEQLIIDLRLFRRLRFRAIARLSGTTEDAAGQAYKRAIVRLRELFNVDS